MRWRCSSFERMLPPLRRGGVAASGGRLAATVALTAPDGAMRLRPIVPRALAPGIRVLRLRAARPSQRPSQREVAASGGRLAATVALMAPDGAMGLLPIVPRALAPGIRALRLRAVAPCPSPPCPREVAASGGRPAAIVALTAPDGAMRLRPIVPSALAPGIRSLRLRAARPSQRPSQREVAASG